MYLRIILIFLSAIIAFSPGTAQKAKKKVTISGIVTDVSKNPVSGAMILIDNDYTNIDTNNKGFFKIRVKPGAQVVSAFTFNNGTGEALIDGRTTLNITLDRVSGTPPPSVMNEIEPVDEVNIGYGSIDKKNLSTPVSSLQVKNSRFASYTNIYELMKGTLPGVQVSGTKVTVQGASSFTLPTDPLFIVDGMESTSIDDISPTQVESIEVLKGASASIYGSRGANGVILINLIGAPKIRK